MSLSSKQGPPGEGKEAGARLRRVWLTAALRKEGVHLRAQNMARPHTVPSVKLLPKSGSTGIAKRSITCPGQHPGIHTALLCPREEGTGGTPVSQCLSPPKSATPLQPSSSLLFGKVPPSLPAFSRLPSVLPQPCQGTDLTGRRHPPHPIKMEVPSDNCLSVGGAI